MATASFLAPSRRPLLSGYVSSNAVTSLSSVASTLAALSNDSSSLTASNELVSLAHPVLRPACRTARTTATSSSDSLPCLSSYTDELMFSSALASSSSTCFLVTWRPTSSPSAVPA